MFVLLGIGVIAVLAVVLGQSLSMGTFGMEKYAIFVDPFKDEQDLFVMARVIIQNTGNQPLTNVRANFGGGDIQELEHYNLGRRSYSHRPRIIHWNL